MRRTEILYGVIRRLMWFLLPLLLEIMSISESSTNITCLNALTGSWVWSYTATNYVATTPAVANGLVYASAYNGNIYCVNAYTGTWVWQYPWEGIPTSAVVANGLVYVGNNYNSVICLNANTGG